MIALVNIRESLQEYHKAQSCDPSFSIFSLMIYLLVLTNQPYVTTLMIIHLNTSGNDANAVINQLKQDFSKIFKWLYENFMIFNPDKCFLNSWISGCPAQFYNISIKNVTEEKIPGITIDNKLTLTSFEKYLQDS